VSLEKRLAKLGLTPVCKVLHNRDDAEEILMGKAANDPDNCYELVVVGRQRDSWIACRRDRR